MVGPHQGGRVVTGGAPLQDARAAMILVHGRGATAESMMPLADAFGRGDVAYLAPQAAQSTWYPYSFLMPTEQNEPGLSSALSVLAGLVERLAAQNFGAERIGILGFSQGACLATEFAARNPRRYGCIVGLSGGLIGPPNSPRNYGGSLAGTPVFLGCSDIDQHIPLERVHETATVLRGMGGEVDERIYPGFGHSVNGDEVEAVKALAERLAEIAERP